MLAGKKPTPNKLVSLMEQGTVDKTGKLAKPLYVKIVEFRKRNNNAQPFLLFVMHDALTKFKCSCESTCFSQIKKEEHVGTPYNCFSFFSIKICGRQRGLADSYHQSPDRSLLKSNKNNQWRPRLVDSSCSRGWVLGWVIGIMLHAQCQEAYERHLDNLAIKGEGLAVGVVADVGFTEEP